MNEKKTIGSSIQTKLLIFLFAVIGFAVAIQVVSLYRFGSVVTTSSSIINEDVQQLKSLQEGILALTKAQITLEDLADSDSSSAAELSKKETIFLNSIGQFNMYLSALTWGSESDAFKRSDSGINAVAWQQSGLQEKFIVKPLSQQSAQLAGQASLSFGGFRTNGLKLIEAKKEIFRLLQIGKVTEANQKEEEVKAYSAKTRTFAEQTQLALGNVVAHENALITQEGNQIQEIQASTQTITLMISITLLFASFIFAVLFIRRILIRPLASLINVTDAFSNADFSARFTEKRNDEIGVLGDAFNRMADKITSYTKDLQAEIDKKTVDLRANMDRMTEQNKTLDEAKKATINLLEDIESEKAKMDEQKKILESVIRNMPIGVALTQPNGMPVLINESGTDMLGKGLDPNATSENLSEIYQTYRFDGTPYPSSELPNVLAVAQGRIITKDDIVIKRPDGRSITMRATSVPVKNAQGDVVSVISVFEDITKEREVDRMKTEFISLASHQLRTPLSAIKWFSEMLVNGDAGELSKEQKEFADNISASAARMIDLVNSLLNISRIESGRILVDPKPTDLKELVQGVVTDLQAKIAERNQNLIISVREDLPKINLDPHLIRQVFMNLLTNAIKYTPKGGEITVFVSRKGDEVISQVTDNGYGIPKAEQGKMFQKFFRAENIVKVETDGTGLGLYLIKAIIESSKGKIWFESEEGKGTTFWFSIPMSGMEAKKGEVTLDAK